MGDNNHKKLLRLRNKKDTFRCEIPGQEWEQTGTVFSRYAGLAHFIYFSDTGINEVFVKGAPKFKKKDDVYLIERPGPAYGINYYNPAEHGVEFDLRKRALENVLD